jgi:hypothetical protein
MADDPTPFDRNEAIRQLKRKDMIDQLKARDATSSPAQAPEKSLGEKVFDYGVAPLAVTGGEVLGAMGGGALGSLAGPVGTFGGALAGGGVGGGLAGGAMEALREKLFEKGIDPDKIKNETELNGALSLVLGPFAGAAKEAKVVTKVAGDIATSKPAKIAAGYAIGHAAGPLMHMATGIPELIGAYLGSGIKNESKTAVETGVKDVAPKLFNMADALKNNATEAAPGFIDKYGKWFGLPVITGSNYLKDK